MPLTDTGIRNAQPRKAQYKLTDAAGPYLIVTPSGSEWWQLKYRFGGRKSCYRSASSMRFASQPVRVEAGTRTSSGRYRPSAQRKAEKREAALRNANSFEAVALESRGKQAKRWTARHADDVLRGLKGNLFPDMGARPIAEIDAPELLAAARKVESRGAHDWRIA